MEVLKVGHGFPGGFAGSGSRRTVCQVKVMTIKVSEQSNPGSREPRFESKQQKSYLSEGNSPVCSYNSMRIVCGDIRWVTVVESGLGGSICTRPAGLPRTIRLDLSVRRFSVKLSVRCETPTLNHFSCFSPSKFPHSFHGSPIHGPQDHRSGSPRNPRVQ